MNINLQAILKSIDDSFIIVEMDYSNKNWYSSVPTSPGWYIIKTNIPVDILEKVGNPKAEAHINIPKTLREIKKVLLQGLAIEQ